MGEGLDQGEDNGRMDVVAVQHELPGK
jgi:hypothetical protein